MQRAGTYHVLAISGGNIAVLAAIVLALVGRIGLAPRPRAIVVLAVLALYAAAVVGGASVARATRPRPSTCRRAPSICARRRSTPSPSPSR